MAKISNWTVVGIARFASKKDSSKVFYAISCTRENDSLVRGGTECCRKIVPAYGLCGGLDVGAEVVFGGVQRGSDFVADVRLACDVIDPDDLPF